MCVASSSQGIPDALTTRFSLALPWWMPSPSLFAVFESKGSSLVILAFLSSQLDAVACHRSVPKLHLLAGTLIFTDRSLCSWGLHSPSGQWVKPVPDPLHRGLLYPFLLTHRKQLLSRTMGCLISWFSVLLISVVDYSSLSVCYGLFKYSQHDQASRSRNLKNITTVILLQFHSFFSGVDFSELFRITSLLPSPVSVECGSLSPSDPVNRGSYIMLPFTHSFFTHKYLLRIWTRHCLMGWKYRNTIGWERETGKGWQRQRERQRS